MSLDLARPQKTYQWLIIAASLLLLLSLMLFPFVEMLATALKTKPEVFEYPSRWLPSRPVWQNFIEVWSYVPLARYFANSLTIAAGATFLNAVAAIPAAFALARLRFPGRRAFLYFVVATQMFSPVVLLIAFYQMMVGFRLVNTHWSLILINATVSLPLSIWLLTAYFSATPMEIEEAAILDGSGRWRMLWHHFIPLSLPGIATAMTFTFILAWNEFLFALTLITSADRRPLTTGIYAFVGRNEILWNYLMTASLLATVPVFVVFLLIQRRLVAGLASGAVK